MQSAREQAEQVSGYPVQVIEDPELKTFSTVTMANRTGVSHIIRYRPDCAPQLDFLVAFQCGFVIRAYNTPPELRADFGSTSYAMQRGQRLFSSNLEKIRMRLPADKVATVAKQFVDGLLIQLRSAPTGLCVDCWITEHFPVLEAQQRFVVLKNLKEASASLSPDIKRFTPQEILNPSLAINGAMAAYWAKKWNEPLLFSPYVIAGLEKSANALLARTQLNGALDQSERGIVDAWGEQLRLTEWYEWIPWTETSK